MRWILRGHLSTEIRSIIYSVHAKEICQDELHLGELQVIYLLASLKLSPILKQYWGTRMMLTTIRSLRLHLMLQNLIHQRLLFANRSTCFSHFYLTLTLVIVWPYGFVEDFVFNLLLFFWLSGSMTIYQNWWAEGLGVTLYSLLGRTYNFTQDTCYVKTLWRLLKTRQPTNS